MASTEGSLHREVRVPRRRCATRDRIVRCPAQDRASRKDPARDFPAENAIAWRVVRSLRSIAREGKFARINGISGEARTNQKLRLIGIPFESISGRPRRNFDRLSPEIFSIIFFFFFLFRTSLSNVVEIRIGRGLILASLKFT